MRPHLWPFYASYFLVSHYIPLFVLTNVIAWFQKPLLFSYPFPVIFLSFIVVTSTDLSLPLFNIISRDLASVHISNPDKCHDVENPEKRLSFCYHVSQKYCSSAIFFLSPSSGGLLFSSSKNPFSISKTPFIFIRIWKCPCFKYYIIIHYSST